MLSSQARYEHVQTLLSKCGNTGCYFLCLLSIVEEVTDKHVDLIDAIHMSINRGWIDEEFFVKDPCAILKQYTNSNWSLVKSTDFPNKVPDNLYTIAEYYNPKTKLTHFRRRPYDTLKHSFTVFDGFIRSWRLFTKES